MLSTFSWTLDQVIALGPARAEGGTAPQSSDVVKPIDTSDSRNPRRLRSL